ncbi:MAG: Na(+)-translocating NADH-quinone reductase subunit C, partial [Gammaproteobacteria bacterium]|nr:Na(+)-translocating NADH-quinone reductase subunit C [Gammaproteobacteria bacterium]
MLGEKKIIGFAASVCLVCSLTLSGVYSALRDRQELNKSNDLKGKVLQAFGIEIADEKGRML